VLISPLAERIELTVPFSTSELPYGMVPMGETVYHEKPYGHPGIDFRWRFPASVITSAPGRIINISHEEHGWNVFVQWGNYVIGYTELAEIDPGLRIGDLLPRGAYVGRVGHAPGSPDWYHMFHWEFGYYNRHSPHPDRLCPMGYFRDADRWLMERIRGMGWEHSSEWPDVCNGYYADRHE